VSLLHQVLLLLFLEERLIRLRLLDEGPHVFLILSERKGGDVASMG
jgi:hypothetical protein